MIVYQLSATGDSLNGNMFTMKSRKVFTSKVLAEEHIAEFIDKCCDEERLVCADRDTLKVSFLELELISE